MMTLPNNKPSSPSPATASFGYGKDQSLQQRRLTRQGRLRHLTDHDAAEIASLPASPLHSFMSSDQWPSPAAAVPLPLPRPDSPLTRRSESTTPSPAHPLFAFSGIKKTGDHDAVRNLRSSSNLGRSSFDPAANARSNLRVNIPSARLLAGNSSIKDPQEHTHDNETISNLKLHFVAKSAPTSIFSSPVTSPRRSSNVDAFDSINFPQDFNDILKVSPAKTFHSQDPSPLRSPGSHSPYLNPNIQEGYQQHKPSCRVWPDVNAHPLPRPPSASSPAQSCTQHQSSIIHHTAESSPSMKGQWQKGKLIGRGAFGSVYHATNLETGASCAMKEVDLIPDDPKSADCMKQLEQEIRVLHQLRHPNIVQYYGSEIVGDHFYIYMEYVHPGSIHKFIHEHCGAMTESVVRNFTRHILSGLAYLHGTKTIHRDIKGANLLVDGSGIVKLADFGVAKILTEKSYELSLKGSPYWMAPELMKAAIKRESNPDIAMAIDIWSLGCTMIEMLTGKPPWSEFEGPQAMFKVLHKSPTIPETLSSEGQDFLQQCFRRDPADRPSAATLLTHSFIHNLHDQDVFIHSHGYPSGDPGPKDNSRRCSPRHSSKSSPSPRHSSKSSPSPRHRSKNSRDVVPASIGRIFNKFQNLIRDTPKKNDTEESNHSTSPPADSPSSLTEVNTRQSPLKPGTLNYMSVTSSGNIPFKVMKIIRL